MQVNRFKAWVREKSHAAKANNYTAVALEHRNDKNVFMIKARYYIS